MSDILVRPLTETDLPEADRINRIAFGTFFGLEDPTKFRGDGDVVHGRFRANPEGSFAAELDGRLVACGFVMDWGSVGILGPLTVDVDAWSRGIARAVMPAMLDWMDSRGFAVQGLFTHPQSARHIRLYEGYGFWMQRITGVMDKQVDADPGAGDAEFFSALDEAGKRAALDDARRVTGGIQPGLDL
ncbi:MAG: GNAT family N-acetyltransferase, partial [Rhodospirillaceae bacterium]